MKTKDMTFGEAIQALKAGYLVAREGWNGKNMHLYLEEAYQYTIPGGVYTGEVRKYGPVICMYTAQGIHQPGWLASQSDMLSDDWEILNPNGGNPGP